MLSISSIKSAANRIAPNYPIRTIRLFGSYAEGRAGVNSDVDLLVEFTRKPISVFELCGFQQQMSEALNTAVDVLKHPVEQERLLDLDFKTGSEVLLYER